MDRWSERAEAPPAQGPHEAGAVGRGLRRARFDALFEHGFRANGTCVRALVGTGEGDYGIATVRAIGCHARRNRQKRRVKSALQSVAIDPRSDVVIVVKSAAREASFTELQQELIRTIHEGTRRWAEDSASS